MKTKKLFNKMVVIILGMLLLAGIGVSVNRVVRNNVNTKVIGSNIGEYVAVQSGEDAIAGTNFVTFDAYFLKNGQKVREHIYHLLRKNRMDMMLYQRNYGWNLKFCLMVL